MRHFSLEQWTDYVRGLTAGDQQAEMARHLEQGCSTCEKLRGAMEAAQSSARWAKQHEPPESVVRKARALFRPQPKEVLGWPALPGRLLFDSLLAPQAAGLRSGGVLHREMVYELGGLTVAVRVDRETSTALTTVVGQVTGEALQIAHLPVLVWRGDKVVARTLTNRDGEFQLDFAGKGSLRLDVLLEQLARRIEIPLEVQ